jgi:hypothetical protein
MSREAHEDSELGFRPKIGLLLSGAGGARGAFKIARIR